MGENTIDLVIQGKTYSFEADDLELGEAELIEDELNAPLEEVDWRRARAIRCLAFVLLRRENQKITMDDVRALKVSDFAEAEPNGSAGKRPTKPTRKPSAGSSTG